MFGWSKRRRLEDLDTPIWNKVAYLRANRRSHLGTREPIIDPTSAPPIAPPTPRAATVPHASQPDPSPRPVHTEAQKMKERTPPTKAPVFVPTRVARPLTQSESMAAASNSAAVPDSLRPRGWACMETTRDSILSPPCTRIRTISPGLRFLTALSRATCPPSSNTRRADIMSAKRASLTTCSPRLERFTHFPNLA